ncbi:MAG: T9SS type A sorting domain-containing protein [Bacteroidales bacterium]|nr:T9SS type A sorting domain-containing protein [Bacteroidales bacterium]
MKKIVLFILLLSPFYVISQTIDWAESLDAEENYLKSFKIQTEVDNDGNVILCGQFTDTLDLDFGSNQNLVYSKGPSDIFIAKYTPEGQLIWAVSFGGPGWESVSYLDIDNNNNIILSGSLGLNVDFDPSSNDYIVNPDSTASTFQSQIYIAKYSTEGEFKWVSHYGSTHTFNGSITGTTVDQHDNIHVNGITSNKIIVTSPFDVDSVTSPGGSFLFKFDPSGHLVKKYTLDDIHLYNTSVTNNNKLLTCGYFKDSIVDFDPDSTTYNISSGSGYRNSYVAKYNLDYSPTWVKTIRLSYSSPGDIYCVFPHQNGDFSLYGSFQSDSMNIAFNSNSPYYVEGSPVNRNIFVSRYDSSANIKYGKSITGTKYMNLSSGAIDSNGNFLISGIFEGQINFNYPNSPNYTFQCNDDNLFWAIYSPTGKLFSASHFASDGPCRSSDFAIGLNNEIYYSGFFYKNIDVNPLQNDQTSLTESGRGLFVVKYHNTVGVGDNNLSKRDLKLAPNPVLAGSKINISEDSQTNFNSVEVFNINGASILLSKIEKNEFYLPSEMAPGFYLVKLYDKNNRYHTAKLIVK